MCMQCSLQDLEASSFGDCKLRQMVEAVLFLAKASTYIHFFSHYWLVRMAKYVLEI